MSVRSYRGILHKIVPEWLSYRSQTNQVSGFAYLWSIAVLLDAETERVLQALQSRLPGLAPSDALPLIGADRKVVRGPLDTDADYAAKCRTFFADWSRAGSGEALARRVSEYYAGAKVRLFTRQMKCVKVEAGAASVEPLSQPWNWDNQQGPQTALQWSDEWMVVYLPSLPYPVVYNGPGATYGAAGLTWGGGTTAKSGDAFELRALCDDWKAARSYLRCVVFTDDPAAFDPSNFASQFPDGHWYRNYKVVAGAAVPSRPSNLIFLDI